MAGGGKEEKETGGRALALVEDVLPVGLRVVRVNSQQHPDPDLACTGVDSILT